MARIQDTRLQQSAASLPELIKARWADSTRTKYEAAWRKWNAWCTTYPESCPLPADPFYIALYINDLVLTQCAPGALTSAVCGIRYGHVTSGLQNPADNLFVNSFRGRTTHSRKKFIAKNSPSERTRDNGHG